MAEPESDEQLLERACGAPEGDIRAFEALVHRYQSKITANCRYLTRLPQDAEDLAQEVFVKVFFSMERFEGRASVRTWIQRIKVNHCLNHLKKKQQAAELIGVDDLESHPARQLRVAPDAERELEREHDRQAIGEVLESMSDTLRIPLILRDMDHLSYQEIAELLEVGLSAVKMRIKRARHEFQRRYRHRVETEQVAL